MDGVREDHLRLHRATLIDERGLSGQGKLSVAELVPRGVWVGVREWVAG